MAGILIEITLLFTLIVISFALFAFERRKFLAMTVAERHESAEDDQESKIY